MPAEMEYPDHGDSSEWAELSGEETRCLVGLTNYYITFEEKSADVAREKAWADVQREHSRLAAFKWYK